MQQEITPEVKARVFAMYYGQNVFRVLLNDGTYKTTQLRADTMTLLNEQDHLILRPLSALTEEDVSEMCLKMWGHNGERKSILRDLTRGSNFSNLRRFNTPEYIAVIDYLRSIGIDLPCYHLGGQTLKEAGLAVYENEIQNQ